MYIFTPFEWVPDAHENPIGADASNPLPEQIETPGATKSGLTRLSKEGPFAEKLAVIPLGFVVDAPTSHSLL